jgi:hypothetical protein
MRQDDANIKTRSRKRSVTGIAQDLAYKTLRSKGVTQEAAAEALGLHKASGCRIEARLREEGQIDGPMSPRLGEMSLAVVENFLKQGARMRKVKGSDAIAAVKVIADRQWPTRSESTAAPVSFVQINVDTIRMEAPFNPSNPQSTPIDITPGPDALPESVGNE